jgi:6-pyruvoyltetrahydropterin/6-carboxytetrahydropterin synthase
MLSICQIFFFESAHFLPFYKGNAHNQHGHSYKMEVEVSGPVQDKGAEKGMIVDFKLLKQTVMETIVSKLDHKMLNTIFDNPTAEEMVLWIVQKLSKKIPEGILLTRVRLHETSTSFAEWRKEI